MQQTDIAIVHHSHLISGEVRVSGYKHATVLLICAAIYAKESIFKINNIPRIEDSLVLKDIINALGGNAKFLEKNILQLDSFNMNSYRVPVECSKLIHGAVYLIPSLLARFGRVEIGECGGCQIGENTVLGNRPIKHMLQVLEKFGCTFSFKNNMLLGKKSGAFNATTVDIMEFSDSKQMLTGPNVSGATKTAILAAMAVENGKTIIKTPYLKADVIELLEFLKKLGYLIDYDKHQITVQKQPFLKTIEFSVCADISEIITYITIACYHNISLKINNVESEKMKHYLFAEFHYLDKMGIFCEFNNNNIAISPPNEIKALDIEVTSLGIYSDHQPFFALLLFNAAQPSTIVERVWHSRFSYAKELKKLGVECEVLENSLKIYPSIPFKSNQTLNARDLRAAAALLIAALKTPGASYIHGLSHLKRGYEDLLENLIKLNGKISPFLNTT